MTEAVLSVELQEPAGAILRFFSSYPIHHLPVLSHGKVVGMLSSADVMKLSNFLPRHGQPAEDYLNRHVRIANLMRTPVITVQPQRSLLEAAELMATHNVHALPVVDAQEQLLGIITTTDIMQAALVPKVQAAAGAAARPPSPGELHLSQAEFERALACAKSAIAAGQDPDSVAAALLWLHRRIVSLEQVLQTADRYLHGGQDHILHRELLKRIEAAKQATGSSGGGEPPIGAF